MGGIEEDYERSMYKIPASDPNIYVNQAQQRGRRKEERSSEPFCAKACFLPIVSYGPLQLNLVSHLPQRGSQAKIRQGRDYAVQSSV